MQIFNDIAALVSHGATVALQRIDLWTGCDRYDACPVWHGTISLLRQHPVWLWAIVGVACLALGVDLILIRLVVLVKARFDRWRNDHRWGRFMRPYEAYRAGMLRPFSGFLLGDMASGMVFPLWVRGDASILSFGGAGTGKGVGLAITNCLRARFQCLVDWGAEIVAICLPVWLALKIKVVVVNPCRSFTSAPWKLPVHRFNPLAGIDPARPGFGAKCRALADSLFIRTGHESETFWVDSALAMVDFCARHVIRQMGADATLIHVYRAILGGFANQQAFFGAMGRSDDQFIRDAGNRLLHLFDKGSRTAVSIVQQVETRLAWMADDRFADSLSGMDVNFDELRGHGAGRRGCIVVFVLPPNLASSHAAWLKVCLNTVISAMVDEIPDTRVLLTVDEAAIFGNWPMLNLGMATLRRYRLQLHCIYQSLAQPAALFGDQFNAMMANAHIKNFVGVNDAMTAEYLSRALGNDENGRAIYSAEHLSRLQSGNQISLVRRQRPILIENRPYYHRVLMRRGVNPNPYHGKTPHLPALYPVWVLKGLSVAVLAMSRPTTRQAVIMALIGSSFFWWRQAWALF